jgi:hypothetical protein
LRQKGQFGDTALRRHDGGSNEESIIRTPVLKSR